MKRHFLLLVITVSLLFLVSFIASDAMAAEKKSKTDEKEVKSSEAAAVEKPETPEKSTTAAPVIDKWTIPHDETATAKFLADLADVFSRYRGNSQARMLYDEAIAREKNDELKSSYYARIGEMCMQDRNINAAIDAYEKAVELTKNDESKAKYYQMLTKYYEQLQMYDKGIIAYQFLLNREKDDMKRLQIKRPLYTMYNKAGKIDPLIKKYTDELTKDPKSVTAREELVFIYAHILMRSGDAIRLLKELAEMTKVPDNRKYLNQLIQQYNSAGMYEDQGNTLLEISEQVPADQQSAYIMRAAQVFAEGGLSKKAIELADKVLSENPENTANLFQAAVIHKRSMDSKKADELFEKALGKTTEDMQKQTMLYQYAMTHMAIKDYKTADELFERQEKIVAGNDLKMQLYDIVSREFEQVQQLELAEKWAIKPITFNPDAAMSYISVASYYARNKKEDEAKKIILQGISTVTKPEEKVQLLATRYRDLRMQKDIKGAKEILKQIKEATKDEAFLKWVNEQEKELNQPKKEE